MVKGGMFLRWNDYYEVAYDEHNYKPGVMVLCNNE